MRRQLAALPSPVVPEALADAIPQIVWTADRHGALTYVNERGAAYAGRSTPEGLHAVGGRRIHPDDLATLVAERTEAVRTGVARDFEFRLRRADGAYRWHVSRQTPMRPPTAPSSAGSARAPTSMT
ncbi:MAG: PAS domain-containing protein [Vicinamibacterales bacterium]